MALGERGRKKKKRYSVSLSKVMLSTSDIIRWVHSDQVLEMQVYCFPQTPAELW